MLNLEKKLEILRKINSAVTFTELAKLINLCADLIVDGDPTLSKMLPSTQGILDEEDDWESEQVVSSDYQVTLSHRKRRIYIFLENI